MMLALAVALGNNANRSLVDHTDRHAEIDHHKDDQLRKQKEGKGHWKGELASNSESAVRTMGFSKANAANISTHDFIRSRQIGRKSTTLKRISVHYRRKHRKLWEKAITSRRNDAE